MHDKNSFITLTYSPENLPADKSIHKEELQKFFKRLRKELSFNDISIRYFACGEYGTLRNRPHYHAIIFGYDFPDRQLVSIENGNPLYMSPQLERVWGKGICRIGEVTFESAAYVARYVMKKLRVPTSQRCEAMSATERKRIEDYKKQYQIFDKETGEVHDLEPEFCLMSRNKGIGYEWFTKYYKDTEKDFVTVRGVKMNLPRYYDELTTKLDAILQTDNMLRRKQERIAKIDPEEATAQRLRDKEKFKIAQTQALVRNLEKM